MIDSLISFDVSDCPLIEFTGPDRAKSLHNLTTQDIRGMTPGTGAEAFVTSPQGKTLGFFTVHVRDDSILLRCEPGGETAAMEHFGKYTIFDDVRCEVVTDRFEQRVWIGRNVFDAIERHFAPERSTGPFGTLSIDLPAVGRVEIIRSSHFPVPAMLIITEKGRMDEASAALAGLADRQPRSAEIALLARLRVLAAWPSFGIEILVDNLPQEIDRDASAISFRKGCYLGQETVARLDALGHVNRILSGFVLDSDHLPLEAAGLSGRALLNAEGQNIGQIRSATEGENPNQAVGMALVRVKAMTGVVRVEGVPDASLTLMPIADLRSRSIPMIERRIESA